MIPMRDGVRLSTDVYLPTGIGPWPAILLRTPYNKSVDFAEPAWIDEVNEAGYAYVIQDTRGRFASEGVDSTFWTDGWGHNQDGYDTIEWIASQIWSDGNVGTYGESARGILQYLAAGAAPPHLRACIVRIACEDFYHKAFFQGGEFRKAMVETWFELQGSQYMLPFFLSHPTRDAFWDSLDLATRGPLVNVPMLHIGGLFDVFGESAIDAFKLLQESGGQGATGKQKLVLGPWTHWGINETSQGELIFPENAAYDLAGLRWRWFDRWVKGEENGVETEPPVSYYLMGDVDDINAPGCAWIESETFPPRVTMFPFFLHAGQSPTPYSLQPTPPPSWADAFYFSCDPTCPVSTLGGRNLYLDAGPYDQRPVHDGRPDVIRLATPVLQVSVTVVGKVWFKFWARVSTPDVDWTAKLIDLYPDGREMLITDGILRARFHDGFESGNLLDPNTWYFFEVDLWSTAIVFDAGHRIMLAIANSNYPRFEINPNNGEPFGSPGGPPIAADIVLLAEFDHPSHLLLPIEFGTASTPDEIFVGDEGVFHLAPEQNPASRFVVEISQPLVGPVDGAVYGVDGRRVRRFLLPLPPGTGVRLRWDGLDACGRPVSPGVYFLNLTDAMGKRAVSRLVLTR